MANHGKQTRTSGWTRRHHAKASRAKRIERRWYARVYEMRAALAKRDGDKAAADLAAVNLAVIKAEAQSA